MHTIISQRAKVRRRRLWCTCRRGEHTFHADNINYYSWKQLDVELYTDTKDPDAEQRVEDVLTAHGISYVKSETWIESERLYEVLYEMEV